MKYRLKSCVYARTLSSSLQLVFEVLPSIKGFESMCVWRDVMGLPCVFNVLFWMCTNLKHCIHQIYTQKFLFRGLYSYGLANQYRQDVFVRQSFDVKKNDIHLSIWHAFLVVAQRGVFPPQSPVGAITHQVHGRSSLQAGTVLTSTDPEQTQQNLGFIFGVNQRLPWVSFCEVYSFFCF